MGATFQWSLQIPGERLSSDCLPLASLPRVLDTARKVNAAIEGVQHLPASIMWDMPALSIARLAERINALSECPQDKTWILAPIHYFIGWVDTSLNSEMLVLSKVALVDKHFNVSTFHRF